MDHRLHGEPQLPPRDGPPGRRAGGREDLVLTRSTLLRAALALALLAAPAACGAARPWYLPDQAKVQLAGNIGFVSPGLGYAFGGRRLEVDLFFGWVPPAIGGVAVTALTAKVTWTPWTVGLGPRWAARPLAVALQVTHTFGDRFFTDPPARFPGDYYDFPTAVRAGVGLGGALVRRNGGHLREVGVYWEAVALDVMAVAWARNPGALGPRDVLSLALGVRVGF